ncbi:RNA polymerase sigma-I factor [Aciduricibacillus chroicocephali]|uniref:RNA polymerase sigma factor SigI n=1 Tax=Aciduricibacillus chroicocephali TaxID=3054939 RepID=A0ABY9KXE2_9BACI|nr:RNA polymerase sigma-I factor [Bacillaceae bacterium 44XB]
MVTSPSLKSLSLEEMIRAAQEGDAYVLNHLLTSYQPFVAKSVSEVCKRYIDPKRDDEFSIGLSAFNEAISSYVPERGNFFSFAKLVIKRKVIDYIRYSQKGVTAVSLDETYDEEQMENPLEAAAVKENYDKEQDAWFRKQEIIEFAKQLNQYKLTLTELAESSPKHRDARDSAVATAKILYRDEALRDHVKRKHKLPIKELAKLVDVSKKTLERNRKFILAIFIVLDGDFVYLQEYLKGIGQ